MTPTGSIHLSRAFIGWRVRVTTRALDLGWRPHLEHGWVISRWFLTRRSAERYVAEARSVESIRAWIETQIR